MKKLKNFWTLTRRRGGFTLIELIVVIAVLAVLDVADVLFLPEDAS